MSKNVRSKSPFAKNKKRPRPFGRLGDLVGRGDIFCDEVAKLKLLTNDH